MNVGCQEVSKKEVELKLALEWNRADIARTNILVGEHSIPKKFLVDTILRLAIETVRRTLVVF